MDRVLDTTIWINETLLSEGVPVSLSYYDDIYDEGYLIIDSSDDQTLSVFITGESSMFLHEDGRRYHFSYGSTEAMLENIRKYIREKTVKNLNGMRRVE